MMLKVLQTHLYDSHVHDHLILMLMFPERHYKF